MKTEKNVEDVILDLRKRLVEITTVDFGKYFVKGLKTDMTFELRPDYDCMEFGFHVGQIVKRVFSVNCRPVETLGVCAGVGKGCLKDPDEDQIWFLWDKEDGVTHYCSERAIDLFKNNILPFENNS